MDVFDTLHELTIQYCDTAGKEKRYFKMYHSNISVEAEQSINIYQDQ